MWLYHWQMKRQHNHTLHTLHCLWVCWRTVVRGIVTNRLRKKWCDWLLSMRQTHYLHSDLWTEELVATFTLYAIIQLIYCGNWNVNHVAGGLLLLNWTAVTEVHAYPKGTKQGLPVVCPHHSPVKVHILWLVHISLKSLSRVSLHFLFFSLLRQFTGWRIRVVYSLQFPTVWILLFSSP